MNNKCFMYLNGRNVYIYIVWLNYFKSGTP